MANHSIDNLFREKSGDFQVQPSIDAWEKVSGQLSKKSRKTPYLQIAAAIALLLGFVYVVIPETGVSNDTNTSISESINYPQDQSLLAFQWDILEPVNHPKIEKVSRPAAVPTPNTDNQMEEAIPMDIIDIQSIQTAQLKITIPRVPIVIPNQRITIDPEVSIKYFAEESNTDATPPKGAASKNKIKQIFSYATSNSPAQILGDLREAKDEFINSKISID